MKRQGMFDAWTSSLTDKFHQARFPTIRRCPPDFKIDVVKRSATCRPLATPAAGVLVDKHLGFINVQGLYTPSGGSSPACTA